MRLGSYIKTHRESKGDSTTTIEIWRSDLDNLQVIDNGLSARDTLHLILTEYFSKHFLDEQRRFKEKKEREKVKGKTEKEQPKIL